MSCEFDIESEYIKFAIHYEDCSSLYRIKPVYHKAQGFLYDEIIKVVISNTMKVL